MNAQMIPVEMYSGKHHLGTVEIPPFSRMPEAIIWKGGIFGKVPQKDPTSPDNHYREVMVWEVPE